MSSDSEDNDSSSESGSDEEDEKHDVFKKFRIDEIAKQSNIE
jgi:hypothetical protein